MSYRVQGNTSLKGWNLNTQFKFTYKISQTSTTCYKQPFSFFLYKIPFKKLKTLISDCLSKKKKDKKVRKKEKLNKDQIFSLKKHLLIKFTPIAIFDFN